MSARDVELIDPVDDYEGRNDQIQQSFIYYRLIFPVYGKVDVN